MSNHRMARRLHISAPLHGVLVGEDEDARRKAAPSSSLSPSFLPPFAAHLLSVESSSISRLGPSSFASLSAKRDLREKRAVYPDLSPDIPSTPPYYSPWVFFVLSSINRLSGELNLSNDSALSNAPT